METRKAIETGKTKAEKKKAVSEFQEIVEMSTHHPMMREYFLDSKDDYMLFREFPTSFFAPRFGFHLENLFGNGKEIK